MSTWEDPFNPDVPIDIDRTAIAILYAVNVIIGQDDAGINYPESYELSNKAKAAIIKEISELLKTYDDLRSKHIAYLREEVLRLHNLNIKPQIFTIRESDRSGPKST